jgi:hypothetical protein
MPLPRILALAVALAGASNPENSPSVEQVYRSTVDTNGENPISSQGIPTTKSKLPLADPSSLGKPPLHPPVLSVTVRNAKKNKAVKSSVLNWFSSEVKSPKSPRGRPASRYTLVLPPDQLERVAVEVPDRSSKLTIVVGNRSRSVKSPRAPSVLQPPPPAQQVPSPSLVQQQSPAPESASAAQPAPPPVQQAPPVPAEIPPQPAHPVVNRQLSSFPIIRPPNAIINLSSNIAFGADVPRIAVQVSHQTFSFLFDTASAVNAVSVFEYRRDPSRIYVPHAMPTFREDTNFQSQAVPELIMVESVGTPEFMLPTKLLMAVPVPGRGFGSGVFGANRKSDFVKVVGDFILVPNRVDEVRAGGSLLFGSRDLAPFCRGGSIDSIVTEPAVPMNTGDWAIRGNICIPSAHVSAGVTFLIQSTVRDIVLPRNLYFAYVKALHESGFAVEFANEFITIPNCLFEFRRRRVSLPSVVINIGKGISTLSIEVPANDFTTSDPYTGACTMRIRTNESMRFRDDIAVIGSAFLKTVAARFHHIANTVSICPV